MRLPATGPGPRHALTLTIAELVSAFPDFRVAVVVAEDLVDSRRAAGRSRRR